MRLRPSVASVISEHVVFELESIDRVYLNVRMRAGLTLTYQAVRGERLQDWASVFFPPLAIN
jgi:hypothetical protein